MEKRLGVVAIILENRDYAEQVNDILHTYNQLIVGRMGIPYKERGLSLIHIYPQILQALQRRDTASAKALHDIWTHGCWKFQGTKSLGNNCWDKTPIRRCAVLTRCV